jgi:hypothetical protein
MLSRVLVQKWVLITIKEQLATCGLPGSRNVVLLVILCRSGCIVS